MIILRICYEIHVWLCFVQTSVDDWVCTRNRRMNVADKHARNKTVTEGVDLQAIQDWNTTNLGTCIYRVLTQNIQIRLLRKISLGGKFREFQYFVEVITVLISLY